MNKKVSESINSQINKEFYSAYLYLSMSQYFESENMPGMANWMYQQFKEEQFHAQKLINYMNSRGTRVELEMLQKPKIFWNNCSEVFEDSKEHEESVTASINALTALAMQEQDFATVNFLQWYVNEQIEEEENITNILSQIKLIGDNGYGLLMLDKELSVRNFIEPVVAQ